MNDVAPPLACVLEMQHALRSGEPARAGAVRYLQGFRQSSKDEFARTLRRILFAWDQGADWRAEMARLRSPYRRAVCDALVRSLGGQSIGTRLDELREEIELACELEVRRHVDLLPLKALAPLLLLEFPAFLLLLFGPLLLRMTKELSQ